MTRINSVHPSELVNAHLLAEYQELPRVYPLALRFEERGGDVSQLPPTYRLGTGHVVFFYDKLRYLVRRHRTLERVLKERGFNIKRTSKSLTPLNLKLSTLYGDWTPTEADKDLCRQRLNERIDRMRNETFKEQPWRFSREYIG